VDVIALPAQDKNKEKYNTYEIGRLRFSGSNSLSRVLNELYFGLATPLAIQRLSGQSKPDVIHFDASVPAFFTLLLTSRKRRPPSIFWHGGPVPGFATGEVFPEEWHESGLITKVSLALQSYVLNRVTRVIVLSNVLKETFIEYFNLEPSKLEVIPPGVDSDLFRPNIDCSQLREKYGIMEDAPVVMCVAKIASYKNQLALVQAMPQVIDKHPNAKFMFVGPVSSSRYYSQIQELVRSYSLDKHVIFTGSVINAELPQYHTLADIFVLPSTAEGLPGVLIEAMSCGKAAVASSIPQNREVAKRSDEVMFVDPFNTEAIAGAINNLLSNPELRKRLGQDARRTVLQYFDWKVVAAQIVEVYRKAIQGGRR
jgi:glycosyltransferase involved in cell wall biosynthesis